MCVIGGAGVIQPCCFLDVVRFSIYMSVGCVWCICLRVYRRTRAMSGVDLVPSLYTVGALRSDQERQCLVHLARSYSRLPVISFFDLSIAYVSLGTSYSRRRTRQRCSMGAREIVPLMPQRTRALQFGARGG